ncbi:hypothetical protein [Jannaschia sp. M317]|uniref:hypothetical protein n=1 Tax=Jannaschia sp. M317 TaxID=2867011 RepID=UPI0021A2B2A2|nr:hypothetical protein [Jannaschia sp. M317]UWQ18871.1 hypothetical protein K3551_06195 [Jannaschia sp. M317]
MIRSSLLFVCLGLLAACGAPHPVSGLDRSGTASGNGHDYRVNWNVTKAQATRTNAVWRPGLAQVTRGAIMATEQLSGCTVVPGTAIGDIALIEMELDCVPG